MSWLGQRLHVPSGLRSPRVIVVLGTMTLGACFDPDESGSDGSSSETTLGTTTMGWATNTATSSPTSSASSSEDGTSTTVGADETTDAPAATTLANDGSSSDGATGGTPPDADSTSAPASTTDEGSESSTGEAPSDCPGGAPTPGEAPYVLRSIVTEQDVNDLDLGDIDGDGHLDLVTVSRADTAVETFFGDGSGTFISDGITPLMETPSGYPDTVRLGAIADDTVDLFVHMEGPVQLYVVRGDGAGNWPSPQVYEGTYIRALDIADLNDDGVLDLVYAGATNLEVRLGVRLNERYEDPVEYGEHYGNVVRIADVTGDGHLDILTAQWSATELQLYSGVGDGTFEVETSVVTSSAVSGIDVGLLDDDPWVDLAITTTEDLRIYYGRENGFSSTPGTVIEDARDRVQVADIDADGIQDVITRYDTTIEVRFADGDRSFSAPQTFDCPAFIYNLKIADINEDCVPDIIAAMGPGEDVCVLLSARD